MRRVLISWAISTVAVMCLPAVFGSVSIDSWGVAILAAMVIGLINCSIGPVIKLLSLPITLLTLGFFHLVINAFLLWFASALVPGFVIEGFWTAFFAAILYSLVNWALSTLLGAD